MWLVGGSLLVLAGVAFWLLYLDALHGYHTLWPVYTFAGVMVAGTVAWAYIVMKLVSPNG